MTSPVRRFDPAPILERQGDESCRQFAARLGVSRQTLYRWSRGVSWPRVFDADAVAVRLGVHPGELWEEWWQ